MTDLASLDATDQAALVRSGELVATDLVSWAAQRIESLDGAINAVIHRRFERALEEARTVDSKRPFAGVPIVIKDLFAGSAGDPMHDGNRALAAAGHRAAHDSELVARFRRAGFIIVGRTATPEFGLTATTEPDSSGPCRNPWNPAHSTGGSSGGSAAAVAAGMVSVGHASDGGGSIRIPASCCGLVGLKPSQGRITMGPDRSESGLGVELVVTRTVRDTAAILDAVHGPGVGDMVIAPPPRGPYNDELSAPVSGLRVGVMTSNAMTAVHDECADAVLNTGHLLESLGHHVSPTHPEALDRQPEIVKFFNAVWIVNCRRTLDRLAAILGRPVTADDVEAHTWSMSERAQRYSGTDYATAIDALSPVRRSLAHWWIDHDILVTPTVTSPPPPLGALKAHPDHPERAVAGARFSSFTSPWNITGQPAISLPLAQSSTGLPIGVQLVAAYGREDFLLNVAAQLEHAAPWADRRPQLAAT